MRRDQGLCSVLTVAFVPWAEIYMYIQEPPVTEGQRDIQIGERWMRSGDTMIGAQYRTWLDLVLLHIVTSCCWSMRYFDVTKHERGKEFFHKFRTQTQIQFNILYYLNLYLRLKMMRNGKLEIFLFIYLLFVSTIFLNCKKNFLNFPSRLK